jgi:hypothetical protein
MSAVRIVPPLDVIEERLGDRVVVRIAGAAHGRDEAGLLTAATVGQTCVLHAAIRMIVDLPRGY